MTLPRFLSLRARPTGWRKRRAALHSRRIDGRRCDEVRAGGSWIRHQGTKIGYYMATGSVYIDRSTSGDVSASGQFATPNTAPAPLRHRKRELEIVVDRASVEVLINSGEKIRTNFMFRPTRAGRSPLRGGRHRAPREPGGDAALRRDVGAQQH
jgi:hypothetical protein